MRLKPVKGHDGYLISDKGEVYSCWVNKGRHGLVKENTFKKIGGSKSKSGHILFRFGRKEKAQYLHRLVYENFVGDIPEGKVIRHLNDDPSDNRLSNLEIGTQKDNVQDAIRNGKIVIGERHHSSKLTNNVVRKIRSIKENEPNKPNREIAKCFSVSRRTVDRVLKKEIWGHVQ